MKKLSPRYLVTGLCLLLASSFAIAADESIEKMTELLKLRLGTDQVEAPRPTPVEGVYQTRFGDKFAYLIDGGRYVFIGDMVDLENALNLTEISRRDLVMRELAAFDENKLVVFPAFDEELAVLNVFTDTSCGYCQKLHGEIKYLQEAGISVHYFPFPRGGKRGPGYSDLKKVWCSDDRLQAMSIAKRAASGSLDANVDCDASNVVDEGYVLGNRIGVKGTPALYTSNGTKFNGYVPYQQLIPQLLGQ